MVKQMNILAAATLLICLSVCIIDVAHGGKCPFIPFCDEWTTDPSTNRPVCTKCEPSNLYGLTTTTSGFSRCEPCRNNDGCLKCKTMKRCDMCRFPSMDGPDMNDDIGTCSPCGPNCRNCTLIGSGKCDHCKAGFRLNDQNQCDGCMISNCAYCESQLDRCGSCLPGFYLEDNQCKACTPNCRTCSNQQKCLVCNDFYFLDDGGLCESCISNCKKCTDYGTCQTCQISYFRDNNGQCTACDPNCLVCAAKGKCSYCKKGLPVDGSCSCAPNCKSCDNAGFGKCDACMPGFTQTDKKGCKQVNNKD